MKPVFVVLLLTTGILVCGACAKGVRSSAEAEIDEKNASQNASAAREVRSMAGRWRADSSPERGVWTFEADGKCSIKSGGLREQKGTYTYTGKELVLNLENGSVRYTITENSEPRLKLFTRWADMYDINIPLVRMP